MSASGLNQHVIAAKQQLAEGRAKLLARHQRGSPGIQVCRALTELFDRIVLGLFEAALVEIGDAEPDGLRKHVVLVPHGGYGRGDVAPFSDVDLMILHDREVSNRVAPLAERMVRNVFDMGLTLGQSVRTVDQACKLASADATICTSLVESRFLTGSEELFQRFTRSFGKRIHRRAGPIMAAVEKARAEERHQYGETVYLLEPNLKRSPGGLRDIQLIRWIGFARHGVADLDGLRLSGALSSEDFTALVRAHEFLLHVRNEMHFHAGRSNDVMDRAEQMRLAEVFGHQGTVGMLPVEHFMREYFRMTNQVSNIAGRFVIGARRKAWWGPLFSALLGHQFERDFRVEPHQIAANRHGLVKIKSDLVEILRLADLSNLYNKPIAHDTGEAIRAAVPTLSRDVSPQAAERFLSLLNQPARLGNILRELHEWGVLEILIPAFNHARSLLQFNVYHKFTVDEHCLRAVALCTSFRADSGPLGAVYRHIKRKWILHLALLIHDLGKGYPEDHSEVGLRIAEEVAQRLGIAAADGDLLKFLVHKHLVMSHLAFRRDTSDNDLVVKFAVDVGSPELMEMLYVLTAADTGAVGPGVLNAWKIEVLTDLFHRTMQHLGGEDPTREVEFRLERGRSEVLTLLESDEDAPWYRAQVDALPSAYLNVTPAKQIAADLRSLRHLGPQDAIVRGVYQPETGTIEFSVGTNEGITPGLFHKITGALTSQGMRILSAEINTLADGLVLDRFHVQDPDFAGPPPQDRLDEVSRAMIAALRNNDGRTPVFRRMWQPAEKPGRDGLSPLPTQVMIDNATSDRYTILDIFAADRMGLLYTITRTLFELGLSVSVAKIGTYLDQVVDVFYVTEHGGRQVSDQRRIDDVRQTLLSAINEFELQEASRDRAW
ncbi:MAG: [protein-PII] uridylyltransferase [Planctomycetes bacterium]|nr:[protein-PII] uridylyltransferase [Planctomycetota bacterium]